MLEKDAPAPPDDEADPDAQFEYLTAEILKGVCPQACRIGDDATADRGSSHGFQEHDRLVVRRLDLRESDSASLSIADVSGELGIVRVGSLSARKASLDIRPAVQQRISDGKKLIAYRDTREPVHLALSCTPAETAKSALRVKRGHKMSLDVAPSGTERAIDRVRTAMKRWLQYCRITLVEPLGSGASPSGVPPVGAARTQAEHLAPPTHALRGRVEPVAVSSNLDRMRVRVELELVELDTGRLVMTRSTNVWVSLTD
jgi:hypothetical protein